jgi:hypothetical protein
VFQNRTHLLTFTLICTPQVTAMPALAFIVTPLIHTINLSYTSGKQFFYSDSYVTNQSDNATTNEVPKQKNTLKYSLTAA